MNTSEIWVGLFGVIPKSDTNVIGDARGAYVNAGAFATGREHFIKKISQRLNEIGFDVVEMESIETIIERNLGRYLSEEILKIKESLEKGETVAFGALYTFDKDDA